MGVSFGISWCSSPSSRCPAAFGDVAFEIGQTGSAIEGALTLARAYADDPKAPARPAQRKRKPRKTAADFVAHIQRAVAEMKRQVPGSLEWVRAQKLACHYRVRAEERARAEGIEIQIPKIPTLLEEKYGRRPAARRKV